MNRAEAHGNGLASPEVVVGETPPPGWLDLVAHAPEATFFHLPVWTEALVRTVPGCAPLWLAATRDDRLVGGMVGVARRRGVLRRLASHFEGTAGGPLVKTALPADQRRDVARALLAAWTRLARRPTVVAAEMILPPASDAAWRAEALAAGWRRRDLTAAVLPLTGGVAAVEYGVFPKNRRNERNRSRRRGCVAGVATDAAPLDEYYPIYRAAARRWGVTPAPRQLLVELLTRSGGAAFLSWVRWEGRLIGGHLCLHHRDDVTAWLGATASAHNDKFPATLLVWTDIEEACRRQALRLDLGGSGGSASIARFKELLGAHAEVRGHYTVASWPYAAWRRLCRHAGDPVGRKGDAA